jgi:hypothetical protein
MKCPCNGACHNGHTRSCSSECRDSKEVFHSYRPRELSDSIPLSDDPRVDGWNAQYVHPSYLDTLMINLEES